MREAETETEKRRETLRNGEEKVEVLRRNCDKEKEDTKQDNTEEAEKRV